MTNWTPWQWNMEFNRTRTLGLLDKLEQLPNPAAALGFRPGPGRAHIGWQFMHVGITEELFATARLAPDRPTIYADLVPRFRGGSVPDDQIPTVAEIRDVLAQGRTRLLETMQRFTEADLPLVKFVAPDGRQLTLQMIMHILAWHEPHHQGQAHLTLNLFQAAKG